MNKQLEKKIDEYRAFWKSPNLSDEDKMKCINAFTMATKTAYDIIESDGDLKIARMLGGEVKGYIEKYCQEKTNGTIWELEAYGQRKQTSFDIVENYYEILLCEAKTKVFDSYCLYLEKNRPYFERFYLPRRKCFMKIGVTQGLQDLIDDNLDIFMISLPPGTGKSLRMTSKVLTPNGFVRMGDIHVGDKVIGGSGKEATVLGVYPQGVLPTYKVTFDDGSSAECSKDHLWTVQTRSDRLHGKNRTVTLDEMMKNLYVESDNRKNYSVEYVAPVNFKKRNLKIDPYVMGALLGNGQFGADVRFSSNDDEVISEINRRLPDGYSLAYHDKYDYRIVGCEGKGSTRFSKITRAIKEYGLDGKHSYDKFIPTDYLYSSVEDRLDLLRGLLDTDGHADRRGTGIEYTSVSKSLAENVAELVHSLGGYASVSLKENCGYRNKDGEFVKCRDAYRVVIQFTSFHENPFYLERKRITYNPKRDVMKRFVTSVEYIGDYECQCIYISDPTHLFITDDYILTHNTTVEKFFHSAVCGWFPDEYNLFYSHSGSITKMYYDGMLDILTNDVEYTWKIIFPNCQITSSNASMEQININKYKPFPNVQTTSIGAKTAGRVRASKFLFVDDLIGRIAEALDRNTLDKIWSSYTTDARQRKVMDKDEKPCKELILATRWSVSDPIGRLLRVESYKNNPRIRAIAVPCCDKKTGESNFNYDIGGFTKEFFDDLKLTMDEISFKCLYDNEPIEREGILYPANELRRYHSLPVIEPDAVKAACDTKTTGVDYMAMPILRQYGEDYYLVDAVCDNDTHFELQESRIAAKIVNNGVTKTQFENNAGGGRLAENVKRIVERQDYRTEIVSQYTGGRKGAQTIGGKQTRIIVHSDWIKKHVLFPDSDILQNNRELAMFVDFLVTYTIMGDNKFDDVPDSMAQFAEMESRFEVERNYASAVFNPLWF